MEFGFGVTLPVPVRKPICTGQQYLCRWYFGVAFGVEGVGSGIQVCAYVLSGAGEF